MAIVDINTPWEGESGLEVERFIKEAFAGKFGYVTFSSGALNFFAKEGDQHPIQVLQLSGTVYNVSVTLINTESVFSVLKGDGTCPISFTATTTAGALGENPSPYPENYTYVISIDSGTGFVDCFSGSFDEGATATVDIFRFLATGSNRVRITVTGISSEQSKTTSLTGTLTDLTLTLAHDWNTPWYEGSDYTLTKIRFSGNVQKVLHIKVYQGDTFTELTKLYASNENYGTLATTYTISAEEFPPLAIASASGNDAESGVHRIEMWLSSGNLETEHTIYNIMCVVADATTDSGFDEAPMVCVNAIAEKAINFGNVALFGYSTLHADSVLIQPVVTVDGRPYSVQSLALNVEDGVVYTFAPALEVSVNSESTSGTMTSIVTPYANGASGDEVSVTQLFDNSLSFQATAGAVFYMNAALRSNNESDKMYIRNEAQNASVARYLGTWNRFGWSSDGWTFDEYGHSALKVPARSSVVVNGFAPFSAIGDSGMTLELMIRCANIADENTPILSFCSGDNSGQLDTREGFLLYPNKVIVLSSTNHDESQGVGICEDVITHVVITIHKNYNTTTGKNICSIYLNGIPNVSFEFSGSDTFGTGVLELGQQNTDLFLYMMRVYNVALEGQAVLTNFFNAIFDGSNISHGEYDRIGERDSNNIVDGVVIDYALARRNGYHCMVIEPDDVYANIPDFFHKYEDSSMPCTMYFEYWGDHPEWNVKITNVPLDGQGTTSMQYFRWNLRGKLKKCDWYYADEYGNYNAEPTFTQSKKGFLDGYTEGSVSAGGHLKIDRFTAKKNIASSQQGHKMGATALYDELFTKLGLKSELPNQNLRVAVWQYPFLGFVKRNNTYEFIGLYTAGPDKGCKTSFGYDGDSYPVCMCIEGPNHNPRGTRFLHPWVDVTYDNRAKQETLKFGGEEGWDDDFSGNIDSDTSDPAEAAQILAMYESEWKPAYDLVYHCSPYIASIAEMAVSNPSFPTIAAANANISGPTGFFNGSTTYINEDGVEVTRSNQLMNFYDSNYDIWFYRNSTGQFENLSTVEGNTSHRITTYLQLNGSPTTSQILAARKAKFKAEVGRYFYLNQTLYHKCYCMLIGAKDNDAKNTYPFKHLALNENGAGNRWGWKQDDLDSIFSTDNNGMSTVKYSVEASDYVGGTPVFQGSNSAFWTIIWEWFPEELKEMMTSMINGLSQIGTDLHLTGSHLHETVYNVLAYYFFDHSALYFPQIAYQFDRAFSYIEPWYLANQTIGGITYPATYNAVYPLKQALGDRYLDERLWLERRIAYLFSKYSIGAFSGRMDGYGRVSFTLASAYSFNIVPAIDLYPCVNIGGGEPTRGSRTNAGSPALLEMTADAQSTNYINAADWIYSLGDLSDMVLSSRGGSSEITFEVSSSRMHDLKIGDAVASRVLFNATKLSVAGASFVTIDARNVTTLNTEVDLSNCPRLQSALFGGSTARGINIAAGSRIEVVSFPLYQTTLALHTLNFLSPQNITLPHSTLASTQTFFFYNCAQLNPVDILTDILSGENALRYVSMTWEGTIEVSSEGVAALVALARGSNIDNPAEGDFSRVVYQDGQTTLAPTLIPLVQGSIHPEYISQQDYDLLTATFPLLSFTGVFQRYVDFSDKRFGEICAYYWGDIEDMRGSVIASGTLVGNGDEQVFSDYIFAPCTYIPAHEAYPHAIPNTGSRIVSYRLEITVEGSTSVPWSLDPTTAATADSLIFGMQNMRAASTGINNNLVAVSSNGSNGWGSQSAFTYEDGKWKATFDTETSTFYLRLAVRAASGTQIRWTLTPLESGNPCYMPIGITKNQCEQVLSFTHSSTNAFRSNIIISEADLRYFTAFNAIAADVFRDCWSLDKVILPETIQSLGANSFLRNNNLKILYWGRMNSLGADAFYTLSGELTMIVFDETPATLNSTSPFRGTTISGIFVPSNCVSAYRTAWLDQRRYIYSMIDGDHFISKNGTYSYELASCFDGASNISWSLADNEYLVMAVQSDGSIIISATGITTDVDVSVNVQCSFDYEGYHLSDTLTIGIRQLDFIQFEDSRVKNLCVEAWGGARGAGGAYGAIGEITEEQAAQVLSLSEMVSTLNVIQYYPFREFRFFSGLSLNINTSVGFDNGRQPNFYCRTIEFPPHVRYVANIAIGYEHTEEIYTNEGIETLSSGARSINDCLIFDVASTCVGFSPYVGFNISQESVVLRPNRVVQRINTSYLNNFNPVAIYVPSNFFEAYKVDTDWSYRMNKFRPFIDGNAFIARNGSYVYRPASIFEATEVEWELSDYSYLSTNTQPDGSIVLTATGITASTDTSVNLKCTMTSAKFGTIVDTKTIPLRAANFITFADSAMKAVCVENWGGKYGGMTNVSACVSGVEGEMTMEQAAAVTSIGNVFQKNQVIQDLDGLQYFTGVTSLAGDCFRGMPALRNIALPPNVTALPSNCFYSSGPVVLIVPEGITGFTYRWNFGYCANLEVLVWPSTLERITMETARNCPNLKCVICKSTNATGYNTSNSGMFASSGSAFQIYVPDASVDTYKAAGGWSSYASRIHGKSELPAEYQQYWP